MESQIRTLITQTNNGKVYMCLYNNSLQIEFNNNIWQLKIHQFRILKIYIEKIFSGEVLSENSQDEKIIIGMRNSSIFALFPEETLDELVELLDKAEIEIYRNIFEKLL